MHAVDVLSNPVHLRLTDPDGHIVEFQLTAGGTSAISQSRIAAYLY